MKRILFSLLIASLLAQPAFSQQPSQKEMQAEMLAAVNELNTQIADLEKQIAEAKKNKEEPETIKELEEQVAMLKKQVAMMGNLNKSIGNIPAKVVNEAVNSNSPATCSPGKGFPERKTDLLNALPKKTLTKQELITFLSTLHTDLKKKFPADRVKNALEIIAKLENNYAKIAFAGVAAWYNNAPVESILLLTYAGSKAPDNIMLNNCGAVLNLLCMEEKALPVLKHVLPKEPHNCTLLNNIGQSFAGLGAKDSAMHYFNLVLKSCPTHPDANATAAYIAYSNGNHERAADYMEKSLTGAYSEDRLNFYKSIRSNAKSLVDPDKVNPEKKQYYIPNGFAPAPNCRNWDQSEQVTKVQDAVKKKVADITTQYSQVIANNSLEKILATHQDTLDWLSGKGWTPGPLSRKAAYILDGLTAGRSDERGEVFDQLKEITDRATERRLAIDQQFEPQYKACQNIGGNCGKEVAYRHCLALLDQSNNYMSQLSGIAERWEAWSYPEEVKWYNDAVYLLTFTIPHERVRKADRAAFTIYLANKISSYTLSECPPQSKLQCVPPSPQQQEPQFNPLFVDGKCPVDIKIPFGVGSISLNCDAFGFEVGEGVTFRYEKNFKTRETTLAVGVGVNADIPGLDAGANAEIGFHFDGNNQLIDVTAGAQAGIGITGINTPIISTGARVGINSSFNTNFNVMGN